MTCVGTTSVGDLLELADRYRTFVLEHVPRRSTFMTLWERTGYNLRDRQ